MLTAFVPWLHARNEEFEAAASEEMAELRELGLELQIYKTSSTGNPTLD